MKSSDRRNLDFCRNAEKPFVDNAPALREGTKLRSKDNRTVVSSSNERTGKVGKQRKVQFSDRVLENSLGKRSYDELHSFPKHSPTEAEQTGDLHQEDGAIVGDDFKFAVSDIKRDDFNEKMVGQQDNVPTHSPQKFTDHLRIASHLVDQLRAVLEISGIQLKYCGVLRVAAQVTFETIERLVSEGRLSAECA